VQNAQKNAPINASQNASINPTKTPDAVLMLIKDNPQITRKQIADALNKDLRTIGRSIAKLQEAGKLKRVGSNKTGHWQLKL
jgi:predicted HTH transcriptional regulator